MLSYTSSQLELIGFRLGEYQTDNSLSVRALVNQVLACNSVKLKHTTSKASIVRKQRDDTHEPIKIESTRRFLVGDETPRDIVVQEAFYDFLIDRGYLVAEELRNKDSNYKRAMKTPDGLDDGEILKNLHGLTDGNATRLRITSSSAMVLILKLPTKQNRMKYIDMHRATFQRAELESHDEFTQRIERGQFDGLLSWSAAASSQHDGTFYLLFEPTSRQSAKSEFAVGGIFSKPYLRDDEIGFRLTFSKPKLSVRVTLRGNSNANLKKINRNATINISKYKTLFSKDDYNKYKNYNDKIEGDFEDIYSKYGIVSDKNQNELNQYLLNSAKAGEAVNIVHAMIMGADVNAIDEETGRTALHISAREHDNHSVRAFLADEDYRANLLSHHEDEAWIAEHGGPEVVDRLWLEAALRYDPLVQDNEGYFPSTLYPMPVGDLITNKKLWAEYGVWDMLQTLGLIRSVEQQAIRDRGLDRDEVFPNGYKYYKFVVEKVDPSESPNPGYVAPEP